MEIGKQSALEAERQLPMMSDAATQQYVSALGARLAAQAPGPKFSYQFKWRISRTFVVPGEFANVHLGVCGSTTAPPTTDPARLSAREVMRRKALYAGTAAEEASAAQPVPAGGLSAWPPPAAFGARDEHRMPIR